MRDDDDAYRVHLNAGSGKSLTTLSLGSRGPPPALDVPFCLGILGDFSGREGRTVTPRPPRISTPDLSCGSRPRTSFSLAGLSPRVRIGLGGGTSGVEEVQLLQP